jgi:23S rRNA pseudouridine2604 synthase
MIPAVRLARRVADMMACSRREAEMLVEGGWVRVNGQRVETPQTRVTDETIEIDPQARPEPIGPVTLVLHKPAGCLWDAQAAEVAGLLALQQHWPGDPSGVRPLQRHLLKQEAVTPLERDATGLLVFTQQWQVRRKLVQDAALVEHEVIVDVNGAVTPQALHELNRAPVVDGRAMLPAKVSISRQTGDITGLRFALKGYHPGQVAQMCAPLGLTIVAMRRIRIGRLALAGLPAGQWRYLGPFERV